MYLNNVYIEYSHILTVILIIIMNNNNKKIVKIFYFVF